MAVATVAISIVGANQAFTTGNMTEFILTGTITASPATYTTGGIPCNLAAPALVKAQRPPQFVDIISANGWFYAYINGSNSTNGTLKIFTALGTELANNAAIPAGNSGDTLTFRACFLGML